jgi:hypothetical protein
MYFVTKIFGKGTNQVHGLTRHFTDDPGRLWTIYFVSYLKANNQAYHHLLQEFHREAIASSIDAL